MTRSSTSLDPLRIRRQLGRHAYAVPEPFGPAGWLLHSRGRPGSVIVSEFEWDDGTEWIHASIAWRESMPTYDDLTLLHRAVFRDGYAYQVFAPSASHVNIHDHALHLWGRADGRAVLPDFGRGGSI